MKILLFSTCWQALVVKFPLYLRRLGSKIPHMKAKPVFWSARLDTVQQLKLLEKKTPPRNCLGYLIAEAYISLELWGVQGHPPPLFPGWGGDRMKGFYIYVRFYGSVY